MSVCDECGLALGHERRPDALNETHLSVGAEHLSVDVTRRRRVEMNRIRAATGLTLREQICRALDRWLAEHRVPETRA